MGKPKTMKIDDVEYVRADSVAEKPSGNRAVVVVDRGWIFAGDVTEKDGRIKLSRAVWIMSWSGCWFDGVLNDPKQAKTSKLNHDVDMPADAEIFRVPVSENWGL